MPVLGAMSNTAARFRYETASINSLVNEMALATDSTSEWLSALALPQNLWVDSDWFSVAFQGWHNLEVFAHAESRARIFFGIRSCVQ